MMSTARTSSLGALSVPVLAIVLLLGGCGSEDTSGTANDTSSSGAPASPAGAPEVSEEFLACLEDQGVELPSEQPTGQPSDGAMPSLDPAMQDGLQACASLAPSGGPAGAGQIDQSALDAFADCMTDNGVQVKATLEAVTALDQNDKKVAKGLDICAALIQP